VIKPEHLFRPAEGGAIDQPLEHLVACHRRMEERLATLERVAEHLAARRQDALEAIQACFRFFETSGQWHIADEEQSVFPRMRTALNESESAYLADLESQHVEAGRAFAGLRTVVAELAAAGEPGAALIARYRQSVDRVCALYREHIASEDKTLTELAKRVLSEADLAAIAQEMKQRRGR